MLWLLKRNASYVLGLDPADWCYDPLMDLLKTSGIDPEGRLDIQRKLTTDIADGEFEPFDYVLSHNVMEHVFSLSHTLASCKRFIPNKYGRIIIFADPLFYSSAGAHLEHVGLQPWGHLTLSQEAVRALASEHDYYHYRNWLNGMTLTSFLDGVREAGLCLERLEIVPDRQFYNFQHYRGLLPSGIKPFDLLCEGVSCVLAFPENL